MGAEITDGLPAVQWHEPRLVRSAARLVRWEQRIDGLVDRMLSNVQDTEAPLPKMVGKQALAAAEFVATYLLDVPCSFARKQFVGAAESDLSAIAITDAPYGHPLRMVDMSIVEPSELARDVLEANVGRAA